MNNSINNNNKQNAWSYYPENVTLNVETMTFSKQEEQSQIKEECLKNNTEQKHRSVLPNFNGLFENFQSNPLLSLLGGKASLNELLKGGIFNQNGLSQIMSLLSKTNSKSEQKNDDNVIEVKASFEEF